MDTPGAKIYAANHTSYFDVLPLMLGLGVPYRFVAKMEVRDMPFIGTFLRQMGHLSFDRTDANSRLRQAEEMEEILRSGESVFVFPEGTFTADDGVRPFQLGAFKAAVSRERADHSGFARRHAQISARRHLSPAADQRHDHAVSSDLSPRGNAASRAARTATRVAELARPDPPARPNRDKRHRHATSGDPSSDTRI